MPTSVSDVPETAENSAWLSNVVSGINCFGNDSKSEHISSTAARKGSTVTARIEFASSNETKQNEAQTTTTSTPDYIQCTYKLIDLGTAVGVHDEEIKDQNQATRTLTEMAFAG